MFSLVSGKMSYERHIPLLKHDVQHVMWYWGFDNSITVAAILHVSWQDWWPHDCISTRVMTRPRNSWLMDTSLRPAEVITAENAQQATALFSCVNFVISACLTIPDQYSIKEFFAFSWSVSPWCESTDPCRWTACCLLQNKKAGLQQEMRREGRTGVVRGDSQWPCRRMS